MISDIRIIAFDVRNWLIVPSPILFYIFIQIKLFSGWIDILRKNYLYMCVYLKSLLYLYLRRMYLCNTILYGWFSSNYNGILVFFTFDEWRFESECKSRLDVYTIFIYILFFNNFGQGFLIREWKVIISFLNL